MRTVELSEACSVITDGTHYTPRAVSNGFPFLTVKDVGPDGLDFDNCARISEKDYGAADAATSSPKRGDVLFSKDGTVGKVHVVETDDRFAVLSSLAILRPSESVDSRFLGRMLATPEVLAQAVRRKSGSAIRRIILSDLKKVGIPLPPLREQRRIAAILDRADAVRARRRQVLALLDSLTQSIFHSTIGSTRWPVEKLGERLEFLTSGSRGWAKYYAPSGDKFIRIQNVKNGYLSHNDMALVDAPATAEAKRTAVRPGDVLLSITADLGRTAVVPDDIGFAYINQHLAILRAPSLDPRYLADFLASPAGQQEVLGKDRGATKAGLNFDDVRSVAIPIPPKEAQRQYAARVARLNVHRAAVQHALAADDALFASLQSRAFRGEL